jgi:hypothetical protein
MTIRPLASPGLERINLSMEDTSQNGAPQSKNCALRTPGS